MAAKFKILCKKCGKFYLPGETKASKFGYCSNCRIQQGKCKATNDLGYQCQDTPEFFGFCLEHFLSEPIKKLKEEAKKL